MWCHICNQEVKDTVNVRGREACVRCQLDLIWDFVEGTRRMLVAETVVYDEPITLNEPAVKIPRF